MARSEKIVVSILLPAMLVFFVIIALLSDGVYGGADNYSHYRIARYAFRHPEFFLDLWGKPVYTAPASIFAQYGFNGAKTFNILTGLATAYLLFLIARELKYKFPVLAIIMLCSMPVYFLLMISSLTEIIFSFFITLSTWLFLNKKYYGFAIVASFIPFARNEGFILLPVYVAVLATEKKFKAVPLLLTGTVFYSIIGTFYYNDLFWVFNRMPYIGAEKVYGSGQLLHYVNSSKSIMGVLPSVLLGAGIAILVYQSFSKVREINFLRFEWLLIFLPFFIYLAFHSWLWWKGLGASLGLLRVMGGVLPLAALLCMKTTTFVFDKVHSRILVQAVLVVALLFLLVREPFRTNQIPIPYSRNEALLKEASDWVIRDGYAGKKIYYSDPQFCFFLDINPFDMTRVQERVPDKAHPESGIAEGEIVVWDAHFSSNEGGLPLQRMAESPYFTQLKKFEPAEAEDQSYSVVVFMRNDKK